MTINFFFLGWMQIPLTNMKFLFIRISIWTGASFVWLNWPPAFVS